LAEVSVETCTAEESLVINTTRGEVRVDRKDVIHFPEGLIGFEQYTDFAIFDITGCEPFKSMLSVQEGGPNFVVLEPVRVFRDYSAQIPQHQSELVNPIDTVLLSIVTLADKPENITVNLRGPIFLNLKTRKARQVVLTDDRFKTKVPLLAQG
jgi:flagellar assembly factor FliW